MKNSKISNVIAGALLAIAASGNVMAESGTCETPACVSARVPVVLKLMEAGQAAAAAKDWEGCKKNIKEARQEVKYLTGDVQGKPTQDAGIYMKLGLRQCQTEEKEGNNTKADGESTIVSKATAGETLAEAVKLFKTVAESAAAKNK